MQNNHTTVRTENFLKVLFRDHVFNISNVLCIVRLGLLPAAFYFLMLYENMWALFVIGVGVFTDVSDGFLARKLGRVTEFGKFLDPLVDKISTLTVLVFISYRTLLDYTTYPLILVFGTGYLILAGAAFLLAVPIIAKRSGRIPVSNMPGKITAVLSTCVIVFYILEIHPWADVWMILAIAMTTASAVIYFLRDLHHQNKEMKIGWANRITILRIVLSPLFLLLYFYDGDGFFDNNMVIFKLLALLLIISLVVSDKIDGMIARSKGEISKLGKLLDPFADKIALITVFLCFIASGWADVWMVALIYYREATISFLRTLAATEQIVLAAQASGKAKTAVQSTVVITVLSLSFLRDIADVTGLSVSFGELFDLWDMVWAWLPQGLVLAVTLVSVLSGLDYMWKNRKVIKSALRK